MTQLETVDDGLESTVDQTLDRLDLDRPTLVTARTRWWQGWIEVRDRHLRLGLRRLVVVVCLMPLISVLAWSAPRLIGDPLLASYGFVVLSGTILIFYIAYTRYEDPSEAATPLEPNPDRAPPLPAVPRVSFLLAVHNEEDVIEDCVRSVTDSSYPDLEVIVVNDASTDGTREVLRRLADELGITVLTLSGNVGKKRALTEAAARCTGDVIAFTDSDCVLAPDALGRCVRALVRNPGLGAVSGHARALNDRESLLTRVTDSWMEGSFRIAKAAEATFGSVSCVSGPLAVFRRDAVYNYFPAWACDRFLGVEFRFATDRQLTGYVLGQYWKGRRLKRRYATSSFVREVDHPERRWRVGYVRSAHVLTKNPARLRPLVRQRVRWQKSFIRNTCFTATFMWRLGLGPSLLYYGHCLWVVAAPFMAVRHWIWAPVNGMFFLTFLYLVGILMKGSAWAVAYKLDHPGDPRWRYRVLMAFLSTFLLAWLLPYALLTVRRNRWNRSAT
jgi:cellulose synthase/poly-beta-1,6-N-acetylglucosamine synthase-like glycosyltransferase